MYDDNGVIDQTSVLAKNAVDGNDNSYWTSGEKDNQWLMVDLGANYDIGRVEIDWSSDAGKMYDIQVSKDGVIGQLYTDSLKVMVMKLQILNYMPMHVM